MTKKIALVTGGTGGIGTEVCRELHSQGRKVIAVCLPEEKIQAERWLKEMRGEGIDTDIVTADVSSFESCEQMVSQVKERFGNIEILVNCAGVTRDKTLQKMDHNQWKAVINTNLDSLFNVTRNVVQDMVDKGFGRVVNISSVNGQKGQYGQTNYSAAKAGVHGFTMALAQEVAARGVTVNTISPGYVDTRMTAAIPTEIKDQIVTTIPLGRMAQPVEIAQAVGFFCLEKTAYITGANLPVNGGMYMS